MNSTIKIFLLCPVPEDQKPINEYIALKENFFTSWTALSNADYIKRCLFFFFSSISFISLFNLNELTKDFFHPFLTNLLISSFFNFIFFLIVLLRIYAIEKRFTIARLFYEEASWYDGQIWEKPTTLIKNDKLINQYFLNPIKLRLLSTTLFCLFLVFDFLILLAIF
jgi:hypothetical protein